MMNEPIRWNLGTCEKDRNRPHLINDNHICREWKKLAEPLPKSAAPAQPVPPSDEDVEFNKKWHLVSANRKSSYGDSYQRPGESAETANVGAWYDTACYWRRECEKLQTAAPSPVLTPSAEREKIKNWYEQSVGRNVEGLLDNNYIDIIVKYLTEAERPVLPVPPGGSLQELCNTCIRVRGVHRTQDDICPTTGGQWAKESKFSPSGYFVNFDSSLKLIIVRSSPPAVAPTGLIKNKTTPENKAFWDRVEKTAKEVDSWAAPAVAGRTQGDEVAWLIERGGLCLGFCENRFSWVTFTNENALRFSRKQDAYGFKETCKWAPFDLKLEGAIVAEHMWAAQRESAGESPPPGEIVNVVQAAESLLEWLPTCSRGSSGFSRRETLEIAIQRLRSASPVPHRLPSAR